MISAEEENLGNLAALNAGAVRTLSRALEAERHRVLRTAHFGHSFLAEVTQFRTFQNRRRRVIHFGIDLKLEWFTRSYSEICLLSYFAIYI